MVYYGFRYDAATARLTGTGDVGSCGNLGLSFRGQDNDVPYLQKGRENVHDIGKRDL